MLIKFDPSLVTFQRVKLKRVTTSLGGFITILDEARFENTGKETFHKLDCPVAVARAFITKNISGQFLCPTEACISFYDGRVMAIELASRSFENQRLTMGLDGTMREWLSQSEANFRTIRRSDMDEGRWYFDGVYAYMFEEETLIETVEKAPRLSADGKFRDVRCRSINMTRLSAGSEALSEKFKQKAVESVLGIEERSCLGFMFDDKFVVSPPIWKELQGMQDRKTEDKDIDESEDGVFDTVASLTTMDDKLFVNLQFALAAGKEISEAFGYDAIAPLQFPKLMIQLNTVNLPNVVKEIKATHDIGMQFTHGLAWLLGLLHRSSNVEQLNAVRRMLKYLTTKGVYRKSAVDQTNIKQEEAQEFDLPPVLSFDEALENAKTADKTVLKAAFDAMYHGNTTPTGHFDILSDDIILV
jgi:hypothetical protein